MLLIAICTAALACLVALGYALKTKKIPTMCSWKPLESFATWDSWSYHEGKRYGDKRRTLEQALAELDGKTLAQQKAKPLTKKTVEFDGVTYYVGNSEQVLARDSTVIGETSDGFLILREYATETEKDLGWYSGDVKKYERCFEAWYSLSRVPWRQNNT